MHPSDFGTNSTGRLVPTTFQERYRLDGNWAARSVKGHGFVPDLLPPALDPGPLLVELYPALAAADRALSLLEGTASRLLNPCLLIGPFSQREAILSSKIEDTVASVEDLALLRAAPERLEEEKAAREVANYVSAFEFALQSELPVTLRLMRETHRHLMHGVADPGVAAGEFRRSQNRIGGRTFADSRFVPPPPGELPALLNNLERFSNDERSVYPRLIRFAMVHYQFEAIHPFSDGNGRLGRLLIALLLCKQGQLSQPLVYVSGFFERNRSAYYDHLLAVSTHGDWLPWFRFFLEAVESQALDAIDRAKKLLDLHASMQESIRRAKSSALLPGLIDHLFESPYVVASEVVTRCGCSKQTAWNLIHRLQEAGILTEVSEAKKDRLFGALKIVDLIMD